MNSLKHKAINSGLWSAVETFGNKGVQFFIGIILARLLSPEEFGVVAVLTIFLTLSEVLIESGFRTSLIRTQNPNEKDYSTIFYTNLTVSFFVSLSFFLSAPLIGKFFGNEELVNVCRIYALLPLINGLGLVQVAIINKSLNFKFNAKIAIVSNTIAGIIAVILALKGHSYYSLVWRSIINSLIYNSLIWIYSKWKPKLIFSWEVLIKHFSFGSKLLATGLIDAFFNNIYSLIFGKLFSFSELGYYSRGNSYANLFSKTLSQTIEKVNVPILSTTGYNRERTKNNFLKVLSISCLFIFSALACVIAVSDTFIITLIGDKWADAIPYLRILSFAGVFYPILNSVSGLYAVFGKSGLILKLSIFNRVIQLFILIVSARHGAYAIVLGIVLQNFIAVIISIIILHKAIDFHFARVLKSLVVPTLIALIVGLLTYGLGQFLIFYIKYAYVLFFQIILSIIIFGAGLAIFEKNLLLELKTHFLKK